MNTVLPHYLLYCETGRKERPGQWRFVLRAAKGTEQFEVADAETDLGGERLELLTVLRALESLDQPSRVTLMTPDPYVRQGIRYGLPEWRNNGWQWEFFGQMVPVKHSDLWQRLDRALQFHEVDFCRWRIDRPHHALARPTAVRRFASGNSQAYAILSCVRGCGSKLRAAWQHWAAAVRSWRRPVIQPAAPAA